MRCKLIFVFAVVLFFVGCDENGNLKHDVKGVLSPVDDAFYTGKNVKNFYKIDFYHDYGYATDSFSVEDSEYKVLDSTQLPEGVEFPKDEREFGILACECGAGKERLTEIVESMGGKVVAETMCKRMEEVNGRFRCSKPGECPGQAESVLKLKSGGAKVIITGT